MLVFKENQLSASFRYVSMENPEFYKKAERFWYAKDAGFCAGPAAAHTGATGPSEGANARPQTRGWEGDLCRFRYQGGEVGTVGKAQIPSDKILREIFSTQFLDNKIAENS